MRGNERKALPWVLVVLRELQLVLGNDVCNLVEDHEPHRTRDRAGGKMLSLCRVSSGGEVLRRSTVERSDELASFESRRGHCAFERLKHDEERTGGAKIRGRVGKERESGGSEPSQGTAGKLHSIYIPGEVKSRSPTRGRTAIGPPRFGLFPTCVTPLTSLRSDKIALPMDIKSTPFLRTPRKHGQWMRLCVEYPPVDWDRVIFSE